MSDQRFLSLDLNLYAAEPGDPQPEVALYLLNDDGSPADKVAVAKEGRIDIPRELLDNARLLALGPDVRNPKQLEAVTLARYSVDELRQILERDQIIDLRPDIWGPWLRLRVCVSGRVRVCRPRFPFLSPVLSGAKLRTQVAPTLAISKLPALSPVNPKRSLSLWRCRHVCDGSVTVYERTCCCRDLVIFDPRIDDLIRKLRELVRIPRPIPEPDPGPLAQPMLDLPVLRSAKLAAVQGPQIEAAPVPQRLETDLRALEQLPRAEAHLYVNARQYLFPYFCTCTTRKIGTVTIQPDGTFTLCYYKPLRLTPVGVRCKTSYVYRVTQLINGVATMIYDGFARNEYFAASDEAVLSSYHSQARACAEPEEPPVEHDRPFVILQNVGDARPHRLVSPKQLGLDGLNQALPANAGLLDPPPSGRTAVYQAGDTQPYDCPWARTLALRLYVHPGMRSLGAVYYRFTVVAADATGNPQAGATPQILDQPVSWSRYQPVGGLVEVVGDSLGPDSKVDGDGVVQSGLLRIPYWDADHQWLTDQYHQLWDTSAIADGRRILTLEIFDADGNRLKPTGATGSGIERDFSLLHWDDADTASPVAYAKLAHYFWVNNQGCYGDIEDLRQDGVANNAECQFMDGDASSQFSAGFRAFHSAGTDLATGASFMWYYRIWYHRGLNGPNIEIDRSGLNAPLSREVGPAATSTPQTFGAMLGTHQKCTFALNLEVNSKHTNGSGRIELDADDQAAFALEQ